MPARPNKGRRSAEKRCARKGAALGARSRYLDRAKMVFSLGAGAEARAFREANAISSGQFYVISF
jgi:hypothetical protein